MTNRLLRYQFNNSISQVCCNPTSPQLEGAEVFRYRIGVILVALMALTGVASSATATAVPSMPQSNTTSTQVVVINPDTFQRVTYDGPYGPDLSNSPPPKVAAGMKPMSGGSTLIISSGLSKFGETVAWNLMSYTDKCRYGYCSTLLPKGSIQGWGFHVGPNHHTDIYAWICAGLSRTCKWSYKRTQNGGPAGYWTETDHFANQELHGVF